MFFDMLRIRVLEEQIAVRYQDQEMRCPVHLSIGQEAAAVGVCNLLSPTDKLYSTHRCHAHYLAKGGDMRAMISEMHGRASGCCGGRGGSMHLMDLTVGMMMSLPIVASVIPVAAGNALAEKIDNTGNVTVVFFGDGAVEEGVFHETLNFSSVHNLPILFVCENNQFAVYTDLALRQPSDDFTRLALCHNVDALRVDGNDVEMVQAASAQLIDQIRGKAGPKFLQLDTYRQREHCGPNFDDNLNYRLAADVEFWLSRDPLEISKRKLLTDGEITEKSIAEALDVYASEAEEAFLFAASSPFPDSVTIDENVYA